jgi:hypothetical protein
MIGMIVLIFCINYFFVVRPTKEVFINKNEQQRGGDKVLTIVIITVFQCPMWEVVHTIEMRRSNFSCFLKISELV